MWLEKIGLYEVTNNKYLFIKSCIVYACTERVFNYWKLTQLTLLSFIISVILIYAHSDEIFCVTDI